MLQVEEEQTVDVATHSLKLEADRSHAQAGCQSKKRRGREPEQLRCLVTHLHAQRAEGENGGAGQSSRPRAARKGAWSTRERHAGRDGQPAAPTRSPADSVNMAEMVDRMTRRQKSGPTAGEKSNHSGKVRTHSG